MSTCGWGFRKPNKHGRCPAWFACRAFVRPPFPEGARIGRPSNETGFAMRPRPARRHQVVEVAPRSICRGHPGATKRARRWRFTVRSLVAGALDDQTAEAPNVTCNEGIASHGMHIQTSGFQEPAHPMDAVLAGPARPKRECVSTWHHDFTRLRAADRSEPEPGLWSHPRNGALD